MARIDASTWMFVLALVIVLAGAILMLRNTATGAVFLALGAMFMVLAIAGHKKRPK